MSSLVIRPPAPLPETWLRSTLFSLAILRTSGDERACSADPVTGSSAATGAGADTGAAAAAGLGAAGAALAAPAAPPITATTELICTVDPAAALISVKVPAAGEGISASTLSVEISKSGSSRCTVSPTCLSHLVMVPSKIDSPICGITTSVADPDSGAAAAGAGAASCLGASAGAAAATGAAAAVPAPAPLSSITPTTVLI